MYYIGIDLGTSSVKLILIDNKGKIINTVSKDYPLYFPESGWSEQNPADWWQAVTSGLKTLTENIDKMQIAGISFGGQMHGLVILDKEDNVIRPAILWNDGRTIQETEWLNNTIGRETLSKYTANIAFSGFTAPKLLWLKKNEPEALDKISKIMLPKDYIAYKLSGVHCTDYSDASGTLLLDVKNKCWSEEMLTICNIKKEWLPRLHESYECVGSVKPEIAAELGLNPNCIIAAGAGDNAAAAIGTATIGEGKCNISIGTSGTIFISSKDFKLDNNNALHAFAHADGGYHLMGCMLSAASCNKWWIEDILDGDYVNQQKAINEKMLGNNQVFFLPYLMGERSPHNNPNARAAFIGLSMDSTRADMTQAVMEGVAFGLRDSLEVARALGLDIKVSSITGGGAKSKLWLKILANVLNIKLEIIETSEGPAMGAAILAAVASKEFSSVEAATKLIVKTMDQIEPDSELSQKYELKYQEFKQLYPTLYS